ILAAGAARAGKGKGEFGLIDHDLRRYFDCRHDLRLVRGVVSNPLTEMLQRRLRYCAHVLLMARRVLPFAVAAALMSALVGCSNYERPHRPAWRGEAENACLAQQLIHASAYVQPAREIDGPGICGLTRPFKVSALL